MFEHSPNYIVIAYSNWGVVATTYYATTHERAKNYVDRCQKLHESKEEILVVYKKVSLEDEDVEKIKTENEDLKLQIHRLEQRVTTLEEQLHLELSKKQIYPKIHFGYVIAPECGKTLINK